MLNAAAILKTEDNPALLDIWQQAQVAVIQGCGEIDHYSDDEKIPFNFLPTSEISIVQIGRSTWNEKDQRPHLNCLTVGSDGLFYSHHTRVMPPRPILTSRYKKCSICDSEYSVSIVDLVSVLLSVSSFSLEMVEQGERDGDGFLKERGRGWLIETLPMYEHYILGTHRVDGGGYWLHPSEKSEHYIEDVISHIISRDQDVPICQNCERGFGKIEQDLRAVTQSLTHHWGKYLNISKSVSALKIRGKSAKALRSIVKKYTPPKGVLEFFQNQNTANQIVKYANTKK